MATNVPSNKTNESIRRDTSTSGDSIFYTPNNTPLFIPPPTTPTPNQLADHSASYTRRISSSHIPLPVYASTPKKNKKRKYTRKVKESKISRRNMFADGRLKPHKCDKCANRFSTDSINIVNCLFTSCRYQIK